MRVTNNMIMRNAQRNINSTKEAVNKKNSQMTSQKKIERPSEDPIIAIRSLRLSTTLSQINQYADKNIPDAQAWLDVTETALINMKDIITEVRTQCVNGSTDTLTQDDRNTILTQLKSLQGQLYSEGNASYAGRTVFTGHRTNRDLVFTDDMPDTTYEITEKFQGQDLEEYSYYEGDVKVPNSYTELMDATNTPDDTVKRDYYRLRTGYDGVTGTPNITLDGMGTTIDVYETEAEWQAANTPASKEIDDDKAIFIKESGQLIFGKNVADAVKSGNVDVTITYEKKGFEKGQLKPEYYFNCKDVSDADPANHVEYKKYDDATGEEIGYDIQYTIAPNQVLTVNLEASDVFNNDLMRDVDEMITVVSKSVNAHKKLDDLKSMLNESQYADEAAQTKLQKFIDAAQKEADYADNRMQDMFNTEIANVDGYLGDITLGITSLGCTTEQLSLTQERVETQVVTVTKLQSDNDDVDLSQIVIDYTAAYVAYQASLTAAGKLGDISMLNYL